MSKKSNLGKSAVWSLLNQSVGQLLVFVVFLVTARYVSKASFGIMATALLAVDIFKQLLVESVGTTFYAKKSPSDDDYNAGFFIILFGGFFAALCVFFLAPVIASHMGHQEIESTLRWTSILLLTTGLSKIHEVWLVVNLRFQALAIRSITSIVIGGCVGVLMAVNNYGIESLIAQQVVTALISSVWLWLSSEWRPSLSLKWKNIKEIFHFGKFISLNSTAFIFGNQADVLLSSYYLGPAATGGYNAAKRLLTAIQLVVSGGLNAVALPALASVSDDDDKLRESYLSCVGFTALFTAPLFFGLIVLSPDIINILLGEKWSDVAPILSILTAALFALSLNQYSGNILLIKNKVRWLSALMLTDSICSVLVLFFFARFGLIYLATGFVLKTFLFSPIGTLIALRLLNMKIRDYLRRIYSPVLISFSMAALIYYVRSEVGINHIANLLIFVPGGAAVYIMLFYVFDRTSFLMGLNTIKKILPARSGALASK